MLKKKKKDNGNEELNDQHNGNENGPVPEQETAAADQEAREAGEEIPAEPSVNAEDSLREELAVLNDKYLRLFAEFDNYKRRSARERVELIGSASKNVILALLPVLDDFDRAQKSMETAEDVQALREGIDLIIVKFRNILSQQGVREMIAVGELFDADLHEAVTSIPAPSEDLKGKVVDQVEKGYYLNDKVIRFAKVLVGA